MKCECCGKSIKVGYIHEGKVYGLACLAELVGCKASTVKKAFPSKIADK